MVAEECLRLVGKPALLISRVVEDVNKRHSTHGIPLGAEPVRLIGRVNLVLEVVQIGEGKVKVVQLLLELLLPCRWPRVATGRVTLFRGLGQLILLVLQEVVGLLDESPPNSPCLGVDLVNLRPPLFLVAHAKLCNQLFLGVHPVREARAVLSVHVQALQHRAELLVLRFGQCRVVDVPPVRDDAVVNAQEALFPHSPPGGLDVDLPAVHGLADNAHYVFRALIVHAKGDTAVQALRDNAAPGEVFRDVDEHQLAVRGKLEELGVLARAPLPELFLDR